MVYEWSIRNFLPAINQPTVEVYSVLITEIASGDTASASISITNYPNPSVLTTNQYGCEGQQIYVHSSGGSPAYGPYTYQWGYPGGTPSTSDSILLTFGPAVVFGPDLQITNGFGCKAENSQTLKLFGSPTPVVSISAMGPTTFCAGGSVELLGEATHPSHSLLNLTYQWKKYGAFQSDTDSSFSATATGRYKFIASANGCASTSNYIDVTVNPLPTVTVSPSGQVSYCIGQPVTLIATSPTAISYQWKRNGNTTGGSVNSLVVSTSGKYKAIVQDANGCVRASAPIEVVGPPNNQVSASGPLTFCQGGSVTFTAAAGYSYQWKKRTNGNYVDIPLATNQSYTATATGKYKVFVTNNSTGCTVSSAAKTVNVNCRLVGESNAEFDVEVYPNPFQSQFTISLPDEWNESITVMLYDLSGRLVYQLESATLEGNELDLSVAHLKNGTYMLQVIANDEQFKRVIVKN
ncbi:MAG: T9SS type A sorting domain-containing protein [Bacteroidetes bacterium]|nr:T9SS type A sorting domain-containing protein [Bacteroidota bacterium]